MIKCPICSNPRSRLFSQIKKYRYYQCFQCRNLFLSPQPTEKFLANYYQKSFNYQNGLSQENNIRKRAKIILNNLKRLNPAGKTLLDVGSGYGFFLEEAKKFKLKTLGLEPSKKCIDLSINRYKLNIINSDFNSFYRRNNNQKFDFITAIHLIEHLKEPRIFIEQSLSILDPGGILFVETPNLDSHLFYAEKQNYTFLTPPDHLWLFSLTSFKTLLSSFCSNKILNHSKTYSYPEHFMGIIKTILKIQNKKVNRVTPSLRSGHFHDHSVMNTHSSLGLHPEYSGYGVNIKISNNLSSKIKILIFDKILAQILTPLLNICGKGSILELYIKKKT